MLRLRVPIYILENVKGIRRCLGAVNDELGKLKDYYHAIMEIDSKLIGDVVSRPQLYFIGVLRTLNRLNLLFPLNSKMCDPINKSHDAVEEGRGP